MDKEVKKELDDIKSTIEYHGKEIWNLRDADKEYYASVMKRIEKLEIATIGLVEQLLQYLNKRKKVENE